MGWLVGLPLGLFRLLGSILLVALRFAVPMILGDLLQQCYNIADTLVVGRFIGTNALAAVGATPLPAQAVRKLSCGRLSGAVRWLEPVVLAALLLVCTGYLVDGSFNPFLYFRF